MEKRCNKVAKWWLGMSFCCAPLFCVQGQKSNRFRTTCGWAKNNIGVFRRTTLLWNNGISPHLLVLDVALTRDWFRLTSVQQVSSAKKTRYTPAASTERKAPKCATIEIDREKINIHLYAQRGSAILSFRIQDGANMQSFPKPNMFVVSRKCTCEIFDRLSSCIFSFPCRFHRTLVWRVLIFR